MVVSAARVVSVAVDKNFGKGVVGCGGLIYADGEGVGKPCVEGPAATDDHFGR